MDEDNWRDWFHITKDWQYINLDEIENNHLDNIINLSHYFYSYIISRESK